MNPLTPEAELIQTILSGTSPPRLQIPDDMMAVTEDPFRSLMRKSTWVERRPEDTGEIVSVEVSGEVWRDAMQSSLDTKKYVYVPARSEPYYLDGPIILDTGTAFVADPAAEIRLVPGTNTCMIRNRSVYAAPDAPGLFHPVPDSDIIIRGGVWTTLATAADESNGNVRGRADAEDSAPGAHGVILLHNAKRVEISGVEISQSRAFGIHIGNTEHFTIERVRYVEHRRDGGHLDGPVRFGIIRDISGDTGDDMVALNAWDWRQYSTTFGPISHVLVDGVSCTRAESHASLRLLPGYKKYSDGSNVACPVEHCILRNIRGIRNFKIYDQPNLEGGVRCDYSDPVGNVSDIHLVDLFLKAEEIGGEPDRTFLFHGVIDGAANASGRSIERVEIRSEAEKLPEGYALLSVGPLSATFRPDKNDPSTWIELFSPDRDCVVDELSVDRISIVIETPEGEIRKVVSPLGLVRTITQTPNVDYPKTIPRGGTGIGKIEGWFPCCCDSPPRQGAP